MDDNINKHDIRKVELRAGRIPGVVGLFAVHYWLVIYRSHRIDRWEIWQQPRLKSPCWGHLHQNLMAHDCWLDNNQHWLEYQWTGKLAEAIAIELEQSPATYPNNERYHYWPGPNSNTFIQTILHNAQSNYRLAPTAIGKDYLGLWGLHRSGDIYKVSTPFFGWTYHRATAIEFQCLTLTFAWSFHPRGFRGPFSMPRQNRILTNKPAGDNQK